MLGILLRAPPRLAAWIWRFSKVWSRLTLVHFYASSSMLRRYVHRGSSKADCRRSEVVRLLLPLAIVGTLLFGLGGWSSASAELLVIEGAAPYHEGNRKEARREAVEDALWHASAQLGVVIRSEMVVRDGAVFSDDVSLTTEARVSQYRIVEEWQQDGLYWVRVQVDPHAIRCGIRFGARIGALQFPLRHPHQNHLPGLHGLELGVPAALLRHLPSGPLRQASRLESRALFELYPTLPNPLAASVRERVQEIAADLDVDYVLAGSITDIGWENVGWPTRRLRRRAEVEVFLFDGSTGAVLLQRSAAREVQGEVLFPEPVSFDSRRFERSDYGRAFGEVIDQIGRDLRQRLTCEAVR